MKRFGFPDQQKLADTLQRTRQGIVGQIEDMAGQRVAASEMMWNRSHDLLESSGHSSLESTMLDHLPLRSATNAARELAFGVERAAGIAKDHSLGDEVKEQLFFVLAGVVMEDVARMAKSGQLTSMGEMINIRKMILGNFPRILATDMDLALGELLLAPILEVADNGDIKGAYAMIENVLHKSLQSQARKAANAPLFEFVRDPNQHGTLDLIDVYGKGTWTKLRMQRSLDLSGVTKKYGHEPSQTDGQLRREHNGESIDTGFPSLDAGQLPASITWQRFCKAVPKQFADEVARIAKEVGQEPLLDMYAAIVRGDTAAARTAAGTHGFSDPPRLVVALYLPHAGRDDGPALR